MNYILLDNENALPLIKVEADNKPEALAKVIRYILEKGYLTPIDICEALSLELREFEELESA